MQKNKPKLLIVDDVASNLDVLKYFLEDDYQLSFAINGSIALQISRSIRPDLILLDIMMPEMDGFETCQQLKASPETRDIPIIFLTSKSETDDIVSGFKLGAVDYVTKPFEKEELAARVKTHLKLKNAETALRQALQEAESAKVKAETALKINLEMQKIIDDDLAAGAAMQKKFLIGYQQAADILNTAHYQLSVFNRPYSTVSGDFFYPKRLDSETVGLLFADACGHGLPAALISMRILGLIQSLPAAAAASPGEYLKAINRDIQDVMPSGRFIAGAYLILHADGTVRMSNAGQPYPIRISGKNADEICLSGTPIGILPELKISDTEFHMNTGDQLVLFSDGILDITNKHSESFGKERLLTFLKQNGYLGSDKLIDRFIHFAGEFMQNTPPNDDMTMIIVAYQGLSANGIYQ